MSTTAVPDSTVPGRDQLSLVVVGHVDHGKSTVIGRLLADTQSLPEGKLEAIREQCARNARPMEYAFLLDALKDERAQGITIDTARCFFKTAARDYVIIDAPGHIEFLKNMVSGAARADAALLVIDAHEGVRENSRRHGYFLSMLGIEQFVVVINKMDLVDYRRDVFESIVKEYREFLARIHLEPRAFIPVNARDGVNLAARMPETPWYDGPTVLECFDRFSKDRADEARPLRLPVQDVYKFTAFGDERRIVAGRIEAGSLAVGDRLVFLPSSKRGVIQSIERFNGTPPHEAGTGESVGFTLTEQIYVTRGEVACRENQPLPQVSSRIRADLFWLGKRPMTAGRSYKFKLGTAEVPVQIESVVRVLDASNLSVAEGRDEIQRHEVAECILRLRRPLAFDRTRDCPRTGRFVVVDDYTIAGGGIVREALTDEETPLRKEAFQRDEKWVRGISPEARAERYSQRAALVLITGARGVGRKSLAADLEQHLFEAGRMVYFLGIGSVVHGLDSDVPRSGLEADAAVREHVRRLGETLHVLLDAGLIVVCTALNLTRRNIEDIRTLIGAFPMLTVCIGAGDPEAEFDLRLPAPCVSRQALPQLIGQLREARIIPDL